MSSSAAYNDIVSTSNPSESSFPTGAAGGLLVPYTSAASFYSSSTNNGTSGQTAIGYADQYSNNKSGYNHQTFNPSSYSAYSQYPGMGMGVPSVLGHDDGTMVAYGTNHMAWPYSTYANYAAIMAQHGQQYFGLNGMSTSQSM